MDSSIYISHDVLLAELFRFKVFVDGKDREKGVYNPTVFSFCDIGTFLGSEEEYKSTIAKKAAEVLRRSEWTQGWIGSGKIIDCAKKAMNRSQNLVDLHQQTHFRNVIRDADDEKRLNIERCLFRLYKTTDEERAFSELQSLFGSKYDLISYLFFIKDPSRFMPIRTKSLDQSFQKLQIDFKTTGKCSWGNYARYNKLIKCIRQTMNAALPQSSYRMLDAHSFLWIIHEKKYLDWEPTKDQLVEIETLAEAFMTEDSDSLPWEKTYLTTARERSRKIAQSAKDRANGYCQLCQIPAPFKDKNGNPFLEVHHIIWLSERGRDSLDNVACLCPNCHRKMHILNDPTDVAILKAVASQN